MNRLIVLGLSFLIIVSMLLASCSTSNPIQTTTKSTTTTVIQTATQTTNATTTTTAKTTSSVTTTSASQSGNWWDSFGKPQYGGELVIRVKTNFVNFDPINAGGLSTITYGYMEKLHADDWKLNPTIFSYKIAFRPSDYVKGWLASSWEMTDLSTYVVHLRQGIQWQNIPPANGRELVADDVAFSYDRLYGLGHGYTKPAPAQTGAPWNSLVSATATDKYTVVFKWNVTSPELILETIQTAANTQNIVNPETVRQWGDLNDWHHAIGSGAFILSDFVSGSSAILTKNPNYWGYDERYPQNKLPYLDSVKVLIIPDNSTALAAIRTGKIDYVDQITTQDVQSLQKSNPELAMTSVPAGNAVTIDPRDDKVPFSDIRVRKAMQMALDLPTIAKTYYAGTADPYPCSVTSMYMSGWGLPYLQWPQDLKDEYAYNPTAAKKLLADAGYPSGFKTVDVVDVAADLDLIQIIKSYFGAVGIDMQVQPMDSASYTSWINASKNDQLTQKSSGILGNTTEPTRQVQRYNTTYSSNMCHVSDPVYDAFYPAVLAASNVDMVKKILSDANLFVARQHYSISLLQTSVLSLNQPWLKGFTGQSLALTSSGSGPNYLSFYAARFWVDSSLKKSMGR
jgi:peptide/nickel transport system substrate-binding protein